MQAINYNKISSSEIFSMFLKFFDWSSRSTFIIFILKLKFLFYNKIFYIFIQNFKILIKKMEVYLNNI